MRCVALQHFCTGTSSPFPEVNHAEQTCCADAQQYVLWACLWDPLGCTLLVSLLLLLHFWRTRHAAAFADSAPSPMKSTN